MKHRPRFVFPPVIATVLAPKFAAMMGATMSLAITAMMALAVNAVAISAHAATPSAKPAASSAAAPAFNGPKRDLTVEFRQIEEGRDPAATGSGGRYSAGTGGSGAGSANWEPQMLQVRNGEKGSLRLTDAIPMQWVSGVQAPTAGTAMGAVPGANAANFGGGAQTQAQAQGGAVPGANSQNGAGVQNSVVWFDSGQSMTVTPKWPGGNQSVVLEIDVQRPFTEPRQGADLPTQTRNAVTTTVTVPLAQWMTIAATGRAAREGSYSSESASQVRRLLQVRVMAP